MPPDDDVIRVRHMVEAAQSALDFANGRARIDLDSDRMLLMAIVKAVEIVGEAAVHITAATKAEIPDVPWSSVIGMRHRLTHAYFDIDQAVVWATVEQDLEPLVARLSQWLEASGAGAPPH